MTQTDFNNKYKSKLLEAFKFTIDFLESHNLRWWAAYGTCIGAVRHHGMIPWDDDIDILMPREDFDKLRLLQTELENSKYVMASLDTDRYPNPFLEIYDATTTVVEIKKRPFLLGVWVDIFPLDKTSENDVAINDNLAIFSKLCAKYKASLSKYYLSDMFSLLSHCKFKSLLLEVFNILTKPNNSHETNKQLRCCIKGLNHVQGEKMVSYSAGFFGAKCIYESSWFDGFEWVDFEDFKVKIPQGYDKYLTYAYGDYMTPPPVEKQITHHSQYYVNLKERLNWEEVKRRVNAGKNFEL